VNLIIRKRSSRGFRSVNSTNLSPVQPLEVSLGTPALRFHPASKPDQAAISQARVSTRKRFMRVD
jgi:hypothetical protein